ncbi:MAG: hypothetical protein KC431_08115 [Myxococcales bacterium]|nr:hypothetical protein [Myxococcales bacterium]MCA9697475.1 hypothetical protein [Myxococcales bacterium]
MKNIRTLLAIAALAPILAACGPAPAEVCDHVVDLMKKELGEQVGAMSDDDIKEIKDTCVKDAEKEKEMKGALEYNKEAKCVMAAASLADLDKCGKKEEAK